MVIVIGFSLFHRIWGVSELPTAHQRWRVFPPDIKILLNFSNIINVVLHWMVYWH